MKKSLLFIFMLVSLSSVAQSPIWTKGNAVWHYRFNNALFGYVKVWEDGDTILLGKQCKKLKSENHYFIPTPGNGPFMEGVADYISGIVYASNDTVYHWDADHFSILYNFSAQANDEWFLETGASNYGCNDTSVCIVQSVGIVNLGGQNHTELTVGYASDARYYINGKVNSRFGASESYLLPVGRSCDGSNVAPGPVKLLCFEDDSLFYNPTDEGCEFHLGLDESQMSKISVFPNPSFGKVELLSEIPLKTIRVTNVLGTTLKEFETNLTLEEIDLSELPRGTYYLKIENSKGENLIKPVQLLGK